MEARLAADQFPPSSHDGCLVGWAMPAGVHLRCECGLMSTRWLGRPRRAYGVQAGALWRGEADPKPSERRGAVAQLAKEGKRGRGLHDADTKVKTERAITDYVISVQYVVDNEVEHSAHARQSTHATRESTLNTMVQG